MVAGSGGKRNAPDPPSGCQIAFAFADIEGRTVRWERDRAAMESAVRRHDAILRTTIEQDGGAIFKTVGDAFYIRALAIGEGAHGPDHPATKATRDALSSLAK
jgi:class 3 adenylate cyclase